MKNNSVSLHRVIKAEPEKVFRAFNDPLAHSTWIPPYGYVCQVHQMDFKIGGKFKHRMEAKDGSFGFDFEGTYDTVNLYNEISYTMPDGRTATTLFEEKDGKTIVTTTFDAETENDPEFQKQGWQAILNSFTSYTETLA